MQQRILFGPDPLLTVSKNLSASLPKEVWESVKVSRSAPVHSSLSCRQRRG